MRALLASLVVCLGCGSVKTGADAPSGTDGAGADADPNAPDARPDATPTGCPVACQAPDSTNGQPVVGTAPCVADTNACGPQYAYLDTVDVCGCSAGAPSLFVFPMMAGTGSVALVAANPGGINSWSIQVGMTCYGGAPACTMGSDCIAGEVWAWNNVNLLGATAITVHLDDGVGCTPTNQRYRFTLAP